jgi:2-oxoglutarate dehydrogenase E1 component
MQVANCTTPANYFHILRRQLHRDYRKPLIIMTPKSLLRHKGAVSSLKEMAEKTCFQPLLPDPTKTDPVKINRLILCSGKVYYDLVEERDKRGQKDTYIIRMEQLYPFPEKNLQKTLASFKNVEKIVWCQEEPKNMGAWFFVEPRLEEVFAKTGLKNLKRALYAGRKESAATATGLASVHEKEQATLVDQALTL